MSEIVEFPRPAGRAVARAFEDPRWAELHHPDRQDEADGARVVAADCICTVGTLCRHNAACPRRTVVVKTPIDADPRVVRIAALRTFRS